MKRAPEDIRSALGKAVRDLRADRRLTQDELAERAGIHAHYVSNIERGKRNVAVVNLTYLAEAFEMMAAELLTAAGL